MSKDVYEESGKAAEALAKSLGISVEELMRRTRSKWNSLASVSINVIASEGKEARPLIVNGETKPVKIKKL